MSEEKKRTLVLCVDHDNDIGVKTGAKTPIIGREINLEIASKLALVDPEESDANAIFGAIRAYDSLSIESVDTQYQIATIAGSEYGGIRADRQVRDQLLDVLAQFAADSVILITDGFSDEAVIPIVQSHVPLLSIRRIVVKHSERIEESWAVFLRYIAKLGEDPYYSRWALGVPGILLISLAALWFFAREYVSIVLLIFIGSLLVIKGFNVDKRIEALIFPNPPNLIRLFTTVTSLIIIGLGVYQTYANFEGVPYSWPANAPQLIGWIMRFAINLLIIGFCIFLVGITIYFYLLRDPRIWWTIVGIVATLWMREVSLAASEILLSSPITTDLIQRLIIAAGLGIATTLTVILITFNLGKRFEYYFNRHEEKRNAEG